MIRKPKNICEKIAEKTQSMIYSQDYLNETKENPQDFTRNRKMPFPELVKFMLTRAKCSTQNALERFFDKLGTEVHMTQQAFSAARDKLKVCAFTRLFYMTAEEFYSDDYHTYRGYRVLAIDGSKITLPDIPLLGQIYGTMGPDKSSPKAQGSICYDVLNKVIVDALIEPLATDERTLALRHVANLEKSRRFNKELAIMDRGYPSIEMVSELRDAGVSFLMRVKQGFNKEIDAQSVSDGRVVLRKTGFKDQEVRVIKFKLPSGETETLITDIYHKNMGVKAFKKLYYLRWPVETKYDEVKNKLGIENFTGYSKKAIEQDFYATMYLSNVAAAAWWEAQAVVESEREGKDNKYAYKVNVNHEIGVLKDRFIFALSRDNAAEEIGKIIKLLAKRVCPVKPGRSPTRNKSPRRAKYHANSRANF
jgi:hypothetical protein